MLFPYSTDAPIYYYPITTITLIVVNVICFFAFCFGQPNDVEYLFEDPVGKVYTRLDAKAKAREMMLNGQDPNEFLDTLEISSEQSDSLNAKLMLQFGRGYLPWQWVTNMFMHQDLMHLIGNMIFLWSFGLVVEGKVGNASFAGLYLSMGIVQSIIVQTLMFFSHGAALGASGAIFAVLALVVVFAPANSFEVILLLVFRPLVFEMPISAFCGFYLAWNVLFFAIGGATMSSEALHLIGFLVGLPVGLLLLTQGFVDCEGYDLLSHWQGTEGKKSQVGKQRRRERANAQDAKRNGLVAEVTPEQTQQLISGQVDAAITARNFPVAIALHNKLVTEVPGTGWAQPQLAEIIKGLLQDKHYAQAAPLMEQHIESFEVSRFSMQAYLVKLWLQANRPRHALRYLKAINPGHLTAGQILELRKLAKHAQKQIAEGVLEVE